MKIFEMTYDNDTIQLDIPGWVEEYLAVDKEAGASRVCIVLWSTVRDMARLFMGEGKTSGNVYGTVACVPVSASFWRRGDGWSMSVSRSDGCGAHTTVVSVDRGPGFPTILRFGSMSDAMWVMQNAGPLSAFLEDCAGDAALANQDPRDLYRQCYNSMSGFDIDKLRGVSVWTKSVKEEA